MTWRTTISLAPPSQTTPTPLVPSDTSGDEVEEPAEEEEPAAAAVACGGSGADAWLGRWLLASTFAATPATSAVFLPPTAEASDSTETAPAAQDSRSSGVMPLTRRRRGGRMLQSLHF